MLTRGPLLSIGVLGAIWILMSLIWAYGSVDGARAQAQATYGKLMKADTLFDVKNATLGFSRIFVASLPERTDKRDTLSLAASLTGIDFEWSDGVDGTKVAEKSIPDSWDREETNSTYGCWRAHMNIIQKIVKEQIPTALIMEDDADWDVNIKSQLVEFARGSRYILEQENSNPHSPYGDGWDALWLGHCGAKNSHDDQRYWVTRDDPTAVPPSLWGYFRRQPNLTPTALNGTFNRVVFKPYRGLCMFGYALSLQGARRLLEDQALEAAQVSDRALNRLCTTLGGSCLTAYPTLIGSHKPAGPPDRGSDRVDIGGSFREKGETFQIVFSTKLNFKALVGLGKDEVVKSQWPEQTMLSEMNGTEGLEIPRGEGVWVESGEYEEFDYVHAG